MKDYYKIGEISKIYGIGRDSLMYYEDIGILKPFRDKNGYRMYKLSDIWRLNLIKELRSLNFPMKKIKEYLDDRNIESTKEILNKEIIYGRIGFGWFIQDDFIVVKVSAVTDKLLEFKEIVCNVLEGNYILDAEWFELYKKDAKMSILKRFESHSSVLGNFHYNKDCSGLEKIDEVSDINKFNFDEFKNFIDQLSLRHKTVITVVDEK